MPMTLDWKVWAQLIQDQVKKKSSPLLVKNLGKPAVLVFYCSYKKNREPSGSKQHKFIISNIL